MTHMHMHMHIDDHISAWPGKPCNGSCHIPGFPQSAAAQRAGERSKKNPRKDISILFMSSHQEFIGITGASAEVASSFLRHYNGDLNAAITAYYDNPVPDWSSDSTSAPSTKNNGGMDAATAAAIAASLQTANQ